VRLGMSLQPVNEMTRIKRLEFSKDVRLEIFRRAGGPGKIRCEGCDLSLMGKLFEVDHTIECWEMEEVEHGYRPPLTADDGKLLGKDCCHKPKSARKAGERAHGKRLIEKAARVNVKPQSRFRKKLNGQVVCRETGEVVGRS
jgi:hypothetical protein